MQRVAKFLVPVLWVLSQTAAYADHQFEDEIKAFERADAVNPPTPGEIVFSGSSSIRLWDLSHYFPGTKALNRGFGGSEISDVIYFADRALLNYRPRLIVFYSGENDIAYFGKTVDQVFIDFKNLYTKIITTLPSARLVFISLKPSPGRQQYWKKFRALNSAVAQFLSDKPGTNFVDVYSLLVGPSGEAQPQYFEDDMHLNDTGYQVWTQAIKPFVSLSHP